MTAAKAAGDPGATFADGLVRAGRYRDATAAFVQLSRSDPAAAQLGLGRMALAQHRFVRAERHLWECLRSDGAPPHIRTWIAACRLGRGDASGAAKLASSAFAAGDLSAFNALCRGRAHAACGRLVAARSCLLSALDGWPSSGDDTSDAEAALPLRLALIRVDWDMGDRAGQLEALATLLRHHPGHAPAWELSATLLMEAGQLVRAEEVLTTAVDADPSAATLQFLYAELLLRTGHVDAVHGRIDVLEALAAGHPHWLLEMSSLHGELADAGAAVARLIDALDAEPEHPEVLYRMGGFAESQGEVAAALDFYRRATSQDARHEAALARLAALDAMSA